MLRRPPEPSGSCTTRKCTAPGVASRVFRHRKGKLLGLSRMQRISDSEPCGTPHPGRYSSPPYPDRARAASDWNAPNRHPLRTHDNRAPEAVYPVQHGPNERDPHILHDLLFHDFCAPETENNRPILSLDIVSASARVVLLDKELNPCSASAMSHCTSGQPTWT